MIGGATKRLQKERKPINIYRIDGCLTDFFKDCISLKVMHLNTKATCFLMIGWVVGSVLCNQLEDGWLDPLDPLSYDPAKTEKDYQKYMRSKYQEDHMREPVNNNNEQDNTVHEQNPNNQCETELLEVEKLKLLISKQPACETDFFKQFVAKLVYGLKHAHEDKSSDESHFEIALSITEHGMKTLDHFAQNSVGVNVVDAHSVLNDMIKGFRQVDMLEDSRIDWTWWISSIFQVTASIAFLFMSIMLYWCSGIPWQRLLGSAFIIMFIMSIPWNWYSLYQKAVATRMAKSHLNVPPECNPENMPFWRSVLSGFTLGDPCKEYYETLHVDPWGEVPPTKAFALTVTKFILEPVEHIGGAFGKMLKACVKDLPIQLWPVAIGLVITSFFLILIMVFGYRINVCYLLGLEPSHQHSLMSSEKKMLEDLKRVIDEQQHIIKDALEQIRQPCISNGEDSQDKMMPGDHSTPRISSSVECLKPANDKKKRKKQPFRVLSDSSIAAQCGHTREEDKCALKSRDMSGGDQKVMQPPDGSGAYSVSNTSSRSNKGLTPSSKAAPGDAAPVIPGFDPLAKDTSLASLPPTCDVEDVGLQESHRSSLRPSESSDDSDLEIIEEEPENMLL